MKTIFPWVLVLVLLGLTGMFWSNAKSKSEEITKLQSQVQEVESLRAEIADLKKSTTPPDEIERLRRDNQELIRLRSELGMMRKEKDQVARQLTVAQSEAQRAAEIAAAESQKAQEKEQVLARAQTQIITDGVAQKMAQVRDACINNLRQIDGAKQQWALETGKTANAEPRKEDLLPYFQNQQFPVCPGAGVYKLNAVSAHPTCSLQTHTLGQ